MTSSHPTEEKKNLREEQHRLIERTLRGDIQAFGELMRPAENMAYHAIYNLVGNPEDAEDILQETMLKAYRALPRFEGKSNFATWFYRIGVNTALEKLRKKSIEISHSIDDPIFTSEGEIPSAVEDWSRNPEIHSLNNELRETLEEAIRELPEEHRMVLLLKDREGFSNLEVAEQVGESVAAVKSRLHRARLYVRQRLERYFMESKE